MRPNRYPPNDHHELNNRQVLPALISTWFGVLS